MSPYFDANGDNTVTNDEFTAFVRMYGGHDNSADTLKRALQVSALAIAQLVSECAKFRATPSLRLETTQVHHPPNVLKPRSAPSTTHRTLHTKPLRGRCPVWCVQEGLLKMGAISGESLKKDGQSSNEVFGCGVELDRKEAEYIELMASGGLQFAGTSTFTLEMWMMPKDVTKVYTLISKYNRGKWGQYMVRLQPGAARRALAASIAHPRWF